MVYESTRDVINRLGGIENVMRITGAHYKTVSAWQTRSFRFPAWTYIALITELARLGDSAPLSLWKFQAPKWKGVHPKPKQSIGGDIGAA